MSNSFFQFKQFIIHQHHCAMKVCTDACLFGAWVAGTLEEQKRPVDRILDIGAGTGLLSLMLVQKTNAIIDAVELDEAAAGQAGDNFEASPWKERLQLIQGDARKVHLGRKYDLIISNPPFFENDLKSAESKRNLALHSDALDLEELITVISNHLAGNGQFAVLLPYHRKETFVTLAAQQGFFPEKEVMVKQTPAHAYFRTLFLFGRTRTQIQSASLTIRENDQYTQAFTGLLQDYYLKL